MVDSACKAWKVVNQRNKGLQAHNKDGVQLFDSVVDEDGNTTSNARKPVKIEKVCADKLNKYELLHPDLILDKPNRNTVKSRVLRHKVSSKRHRLDKTRQGPSPILYKYELALVAVIEEKATHCIYMNGKEHIAASATAAENTG